MSDKDIRWQQRFSNYNKALEQLTQFVEVGAKLNKLEEQGLIKAFEYTYELAWNVIKDYYEYQGVTDIQGSRDAFRLAYNRGLIADGENWMKMIESRTKTSHTYDEATAARIISDILNKYYALFRQLQLKMENIRDAK